MSIWKWIYSDFCAVSSAVQPLRRLKLNIIVHKLVCLTHFMEGSVFLAAEKSIICYMNDLSDSFIVSEIQPVICFYFSFSLLSYILI